MAEILAPVGGKEQLIAAVRSGADAVYLGAKNFNARRNASNFEDFELSETVSYCHARNVKVHVVLNTLVMDSEIPALIKEIKNVAKAGADAVIVQDLAVARLVKEICPSIEMHASTQMTIHDLAGAKAAKELGFARAVLSRELSFDEIKYIAENTDIELEAFIHGALCMCMSGCCYLSSVLGGRSGNRGLCAQPCRLDFRFGEKDHALSLKDMSHIEHLQKLAKAGVCSFKIEGRMKRPEYVAAAVSACRAALAGEKPDMDSLRSVFSRQGFTDGYFTGKRTPDMFGFRSHEDVTAADKVLKNLSLLYKDEPKKIPLSMNLSISENSPSLLTVSDGINEVSVSGGICEKALRAPTDKVLAERYLSKTGGTPFYLENLDFSAEGEPIIAAGEINEMRRNALALLLEKREAVVPHEIYDADIPKAVKHSAAKTGLRIRGEKFEQVAFASDAEAVILPIAEIEKNPKAIEFFGERLFAELPALVFPFDEEKIKSRLTALKEKGLRHVLCENICMIHLAKECKMKIHGGHGLNILNSLSLEEYKKLGIADATVSFELSAPKIRDLGGSIQRGIIGYGYLPLMRMRACPIKKASGCKNCPGKGEIKDRMGKEFTYLCFEKKFGTLLNSVPLYVADKDFSGIDFMTLWFTVETPENCKKIYEMFKNKVPADFEKTNGLYFRELL
ncbi:MAG: U32 family peptidase [Oscillospiraceae bacterium]|nr:U32 family peptidase [Oscillospiraceae bacterium]